VHSTLLGEAPEDAQKAFLLVKLIAVAGFTFFRSCGCTKLIAVLVVKLNCRDTAAVRLPVNYDAADDMFFREDESLDRP